MSKKSRKKNHIPDATKKVLPAVIRNLDKGTPELRQHFPVNEGKQENNPRVLNHPLDMYLNRGDISEDQHWAGCNLFNDYQVSHHHRNALSLLGEIRGVATSVDYDNPHTAFERYMRAIKSLNATSKKIAEQVCIQGYTMAEVRGAFTYWSKRNTGIDRMRETLDELYIFYHDEWREFCRWRDNKMAENNQTANEDI